MICESRWHRGIYFRLSVLDSRFLLSGIFLYADIVDVKGKKVLWQGYLN